MNMWQFAIPMFIADKFELHPDGEEILNSLITIDIISMVSPRYA